MNKDEPPKKFTYQRADGRRIKKIASRERDRYVSKIQEDTSYGCYYRVEQELNVPRATVRYWHKKSEDPRFHAQPHGRLQYSCGTFKIWERPVVKQHIIEFLTAYPNSTLIQISNELSYCFSRQVTRKVRFRFFFFFLNSRSLKEYWTI